MYILYAGLPILSTAVLAASYMYVNYVESVIASERTAKLIAAKKQKLMYFKGQSKLNTLPEGILFGELIDKYLSEEDIKNLKKSHTDISQRFQNHKKNSLYETQEMKDTWEQACGYSPKEKRFFIKDIEKALTLIFQNVKMPKLMEKKMLRMIEDYYRGNASIFRKYWVNLKATKAMQVIEELNQKYPDAHKNELIRFVIAETEFYNIISKPFVNEQDSMEKINKIKALIKNDLDIARRSKGWPPAYQSDDFIVDAYLETYVNFERNIFLAREKDFETEFQKNAAKHREALDKEKTSQVRSM